MATRSKSFSAADVINKKGFGERGRSAKLLASFFQKSSFYLTLGKDHCFELDKVDPEGEFGLNTRAVQLRATLAIRILSVLALMLVAFGHKPVVLASPEQLLLAQYVLPDGSYPVLCITDHAVDNDGHDGDRHFHNSTVCDACRISSAFFCAPPAPSTGAAPNVAAAEIIVPSEPILRQQPYPPSALPQAPPLA